MSTTKTPPPPRVSILIPNYNNGASASVSGKRNFILDLLESLEYTLAGDPTPFELLVFDDGSTDDSIVTLRDWAANRTWVKDSRPFLTLMESEHCGVLSITANKLSRAAVGDILVRLDGDVVCHTVNWVTQLCKIFDEGPENLGVVGPKQLGTDGRIHAFGDWILHPKGYHHIGHLMPADKISRPMAVDHVMGCFYCCKKQVFEELGGYDEDYLRGQTIDFGLRAMQAGWACWAVASIEYLHAHCERRVRSTSADTEKGIVQSLNTFEQKWRFCRVAPDLDQVRKLYAGTNLMWNPRWTGVLNDNDDDNGMMIADKADNQRPPISMQDSDWDKYARDADNYQFRPFVDLRVGVAFDIIRQAGQRKCVVHYTSGHGLIGHMLASQKVKYMGIDKRPRCVEFARSVTDGRPYEGDKPEFVLQRDILKLPVADDSADLLLITDEMERHPNPVGLLKEARRVLVYGGFLAVVSRRVKPYLETDVAGEHPYLFTELLKQILCVGCFDLIIDPKDDDVTRDMVLIFRQVYNKNMNNKSGQQEQAAQVNTDKDLVHVGSESCLDLSVEIR